MSKYLDFKIHPFRKNGTKSVYWVISKMRGGILGELRWYYKWRQYCFYPNSGTLFNKNCMKDIVDFIVVVSKPSSEKFHSP